MKVHEAVTAVMKDVGAVSKNGMNTHQNFRFRGVDAVVNAVSPAMREHGLTVYPSKVEHREGSKTVSGGKVATSPVIIVDYTFVGPEGDTFTSQVAAESFDTGDKATAKAMSVAYRTCLLQTFALPTDDADPDEHTYERQGPTTHDPRPRPPVDWQAQLQQASGNKLKLEALRHAAQSAGAPEDFWLFRSIETQLASLPGGGLEPLEGRIV